MPIKTSDLSKLVKEINSAKNRDIVYTVLHNAGFNTSVPLNTLKKEYRGKNQAAISLLLAAQDKIRVFENQP
jgi:hypothetical protein